MMYGRGYNGISNCFGGFGFFNSGIGMFMMLILFLTVAIAVILLLTRTKGNKSANNALEELKIRLAKSEISEGEYRKSKSLIDLK
jgi:uncharacterized membrane protein